MGERPGDSADDDPQQTLYRRKHNTHADPLCLLFMRVSNAQNLYARAGQKLRLTGKAGDQEIKRQFRLNTPGLDRIVGIQEVAVNILQLAEREIARLL